MDDDNFPRAVMAYGTALQAGGDAQAAMAAVAEQVPGADPRDIRAWWETGRHKDAAMALQGGCECNVVTGEVWVRMYDVIASGFDRRFEITGGLVEGYEAGGKEHTIQEVLGIHHDWQRANGAILGVVIRPVTISYGFMKDEMIEGASEPGFLLSGSMNVLYQEDMLNAAAATLVRHLAEYLALRLGQTRIYYTYRTLTSILERQTRPTQEGWDRAADAALAHLAKFMETEDHT